MIVMRWRGGTLASAAISANTIRTSARMSGIPPSAHTSPRVIALFEVPGLGAHHGFGLAVGHSSSADDDELITFDARYHIGVHGNIVGPWRWRVSPFVGLGGGYLTASVPSQLADADQLIFDDPAPAFIAGLNGAVVWNIGAVAIEAIANVESASYHFTANNGATLDLSATLTSFGLEVLW